MLHNTYSIVCVCVQVLSVLRRLFKNSFLRYRAQKKQKERNNPVAGFASKNKQMEGQHTSEPLFVKSATPKKNTVGGMVILILKHILKQHKNMFKFITDDGDPEENSSEPMDMYTPYHFHARQLSTKESHVQKVNWCEKKKHKMIVI